MSVILKVTKISKQYRLGLVGLDTLRDDLKRLWHKFRGKEDPFLKVGDLNERSIKSESNYVWALKDINFDVEKGEVLGIIGKNGAGKSTLLKILSRVTSPTTGDIKTKGRIASLLEIGTGFHPELTGLENIYLNGAILGMTKAEIKSKEEAIIKFSGCERYVETPVKRYSSGMTVRLAFAVAAFLEPDILIIDEVLAVGDAEFQKKAIGKMQDISKGDGRTVLFVSHNMAGVKSLCTRAIVLEHGVIAFEGAVNEAVDFYLKLNANTESNTERFFNKEEFVNNKVVQVNNISVHAKGKVLNTPILRNNEIVFNIELIKKTSDIIGIILRFKDETGNYIFVCNNDDTSNNDEIGTFTYQMFVPKYFFNEGAFFVDLMITYNKKQYFLENDALHFTVIHESKELGDWMGKTKGPLKPKFSWKIS